MNNRAMMALLLALGLCATLARGQDKKDSPLSGLAADAELVETRTEVPHLKAAAPYEMKDNTVAIELSEYAGYAGFIVANGGMDPNEDSIFTRKYGVKVKLTLSEEESWSSLNSGRIAASATTADVLAVYGKQFEVVVPAQIGYSRGADGVVVTSDIKRINDLKGKVLTSCQFTESDFMIRYLAQEAGLTINMLSDLSAKPDPQKLNFAYCADGFGSGDLFLRDLKAGRNRVNGCVTWAPKTDEVASGSDGKARVLTTNRNLLIVADIFIVNRGFAQAHPDKVQAIVNGLMEGNTLVRDNQDAQLDTIAKAFKWDRDKAKAEMAKVHLANLPENLAFFNGSMDSAGSFSGIYQSAVYCYGTDLVKDPVDSDKFADTRYLKVIDATGIYKDQKIAIAPIKTETNQQVETGPLLSKDIRFFFEPNSAKLDLTQAANQEQLDSIKKLLQVSPGSTILLRGHVDNSFIPEFRKQGGEAFVREMALKAMELSKDRAAEIKRLLTDKGVDGDRLDTVGRGWEEPAGTDPDKNRRVEVQWFTIE